MAEQEETPTTDPKPEAAAPPALSAAAEKAQAEKDEGYMPFGGAKTFAQWREMRQAYAAEGAIQDLAGTFRLLIDNILYDETVPFEGKPDRIIALTQELKREINPAVEQAIESVKETDDDPETLLSRVKGWFLGRAMVEPEPQPASTFRMFKEANGDYRWIAVWSNAAPDRDGETFPLSAHKEYIDWTDRSGYRPELRWWHVPGTKMGKTETLAITDEGFVIAEGTIDASAKVQADMLASGELGPLAVSHGYLYDEKDLVGGVYTRYRSFEISVLPASKAANPFTGWTAGQEVPMITDAEKRASLVKLWGEPATKELETQLAATATRMKAEGVSFKEVMDTVIEVAVAAAEVPTPPGSDATVTAAAPATAAPSDVEKLTTSVGELAESVKAIASTVAELKAGAKAEDTTFAPRNTPQFLVASGDKSTAIEDMSDDALVAAATAAKEAMESPSANADGSKAAAYFGELGIKVGQS